MKRLKLPDAPANQTGPVKAWTEPVVILTYHPLPPDKNPMFLEKRVYQGSSGRVYPLPFTDRISTDAVEHTWQAVHSVPEALLRLPPERSTSSTDLPHPSPPSVSGLQLFRSYPTLRC